MYIYILIYVYLIIKSYSKRRREYFDIYLILVIILGFGYCIGVDWQMYQYYYDIFLSQNSIFNIFNLKLRIESGYLFISHLARILGLNYEVFIGSLQAILMYKLLKFIHQKTTNIAIATIFMLSNFLLGVMIEPVIRQFIALLFGVYGSEYLSKKQILKGILFFLLGSFFHKSICIFLIANILYYILFKKINLTFKVVVLIGIVLNFLILNIDSIILTLNILKKYQVYLLNETLRVYITAREINIYKIVFYTLQLLMYLYITLIVYPKSKKYNKLIQYFAVISIFILSSEIFFPIIGRIKIYFIPYLGIILGIIIELKDKYNIRKMVQCIIIMISLLYFWSMFKNYSYKFLPYKNYILEYVRGNDYKNYYEKVKKFKIQMEKNKKVIKIDYR